MPTPIYRQNVGSVFSVTAGNTLANSTTVYSVSGDKLTIDNTTNAAPLADFELVLGSAFGSAPTSGQISLFAVDWDITNANAGPAPTATSPTPRFVGSFDPKPQSGNTSTTWKMVLPKVALTPKADYYIQNQTGVTLATSWILKAQCWTVGT